jgi:hypothetical protein
MGMYKNVALGNWTQVTKYRTTLQKELPEIKLWKKYIL